jgi:hypothetical protein
MVGRVPDERRSSRGNDAFPREGCCSESSTLFLMLDHLLERQLNIFSQIPQDVMHEVRQLQHLPIPSTSSGPVHSPDAWRNPQAPEPITTAGFEVILKSFEAKRQYYLPSVEKSLSILDKGVRERATKNGETLRRYVFDNWYIDSDWNDVLTEALVDLDRHADMLSRWRRLIDVMERLEKDLVSAHLYLISRDSPHRPKTTSASSSYIPPPQPHYRKVSSSAPSEGSTSTRSSIPGSDVSSLIRQPQNGQQFLATPSSASSSRNRRSSVISNGHGNSSAPNVFQRLLGTLKSGSKPEGSSNSSRSRRESSASPSALDRSYPASASRQTPPSTSSRSHNSTPSSDLSSRRHHPYSITPPSSATTAISSSPSTTASAIPFPSSIPVPSHADTHLSAIRVAKPRWNASPRVPEPPKPSQRPGLERKPSNSALKNGELGGGRPSSRASYGYATSEAGSDYGGGTPSRHQDISRIPRPPRSNNLAPESEADESLDVPSVFLKPHQNSRSFTPNPHQSPRMSLPRSHSASRSLSLIPQLQPGSLSSPSQSRPSLSGLPPSSPSLPTLSSFINGAEDDTDSPLTPPSYFGARSRTFSRSQTPESQLRAKVRDSAFYTPGGLGTPTPATGSSAASAASSDGGSQLRRPRVSMSPSPGPGKTLRPSSIVGPPSAFRGPSPSPNNRSLPSPASSSSPVRPPSRTKTPSSASPASSIPTPSPQRPPSRSTLLTPTSAPARPSSRLSNSGGGDFSTPSRPSSRTQTPSHQQHAIPAGPFQPHPHNSLDLALSALLSSSPYPSQQNLPVSRLNPLPKGAAAGAAEYQTGSFVFGGGVGGRGQKTIQCRLLELNGGRSTSGEGGKVKKVMCRVGGGCEFRSLRMLALSSHIARLTSCLSHLSL